VGLLKPSQNESGLSVSAYNFEGWNARNRRASALEACIANVGELLEIVPWITNVSYTPRQSAPAS